MTGQTAAETGNSRDRFVLATDLDGTFLGGSDSDRRTLYDWIEAHRASIRLIFVTGRDPRFIGELCGGGVPWPEYVIGDVGTTIAQVMPDRRIEPIPALEAEIATLWGDSGARVRARLDGHPGLTLQPTPFRYRVSYDLDAARFDDSAVQVVHDMGLAPLISDDRFFDVLPPGVSKGPSLRRLIAHLGADPGRVLAAGDTMNDLSMLEMGIPAVAVGGSEPALLRALAGKTHVHRSDRVGAAGILDAMAAFDLHPTP
ncbi:MAG: HAD family hydrolase [Rhodobacteraceae bacterium]|nr:HAD family hydrolase [Paracoccaceae bacterium]